MYFQLILLGLVCMTAPCLVRYGGYVSRHKPFELVAVGGIFFLLAASFGLGFSLLESLRASATLLSAGRSLMIISTIIGWLGLFIGAIWSTVEVLREREVDIARKVEARV
ncbi:MAG: hypothetical protein JWQ71_4927 [Pedosphaera sp.]|nr:hypothetical protein [Pedosphaera sp.]